MARVRHPHTEPAAGNALGRSIDRLAAFAERHPVPFTVLAFLAAKFLVIVGAYWLLDRPADFLTKMSLRWDGEHYLHIAQNGYAWNQPNLADPFAFPPVFPFLIRMIGAGDLAPLLVANAMSVLAVALITLLLGWRASLFFALFPMWIAYSSVGYTESTYAVFAAGSLLLFRRGHLEGAGAMGALASVSRYGAGLAFLSYAYPLARRGWKAWVALALPAVGVALVVIFYFQHVAGSVLAYFNSQKLWGASLVFPWDQLDFYLHGWFTTDARISNGSHPSFWALRNYFFVGISAWGVHRLWNQYGERLFAIFSGLIVVLSLIVTGTPAVSTPRVLLLGFPAIAVHGRSLRGAGNWAAYALLAFIGGLWALTSHVTGFFT